MFAMVFAQKHHFSFATRKKQQTIIQGSNLGRNASLHPMMLPNVLITSAAIFLFIYFSRKRRFWENLTCYGGFNFGLTRARECGPELRAREGGGQNLPPPPANSTPMKARITDFYGGRLAKDLYHV